MKYILYAIGHIIALLYNILELLANYLAFIFEFAWDKYILIEEDIYHIQKKINRHKEWHQLFFAKEIFDELNDDDDEIQNFQRI